MRGGALPPALLCAALGLALAFAPRRTWMPSLAALAATAAVVALMSIPAGWREIAFLGCWISVIACAASVHLPHALRMRAAIALSLNSGLWSGATIAVAGSHIDLLKALPCALVLLPASWLVDRRVPIAIKVVSSWLIAIAVLAATLQFLSVTPGYLPDHLE